MHDGIQKRLVDALLGKPIVSNAFRGTLVEAIVAQTLEPDWRWCAEGWASFDFEGPGGIGLEVKQSAARQTWHDDNGLRCVPRFDIAERTGRWDSKNRWIDMSGRAAAIYVFAYHPIFDAETADHREPLQWQFYVVQAKALPAQKSIGLRPLSVLAQPVGVDNLLRAVHELAETLERMPQGR